jgi:RNA polymerase sigma factor (sigma-70 family)
MMEAMAIPPFEQFYDEHRNAVFGLLVRRLGRQRAEDAFQETFLKALRAYPRLENADNLRGWVLRIAANVAVDAHRRLYDGAEVPDVESLDERPSYAELRDLTASLPPKERAAVVLRYGYDLSYDQIGSALGSSAEAARQAASSGVRRLRRKEDLL